MPEDVRSPRPAWPLCQAGWRAPYLGGNNNALIEPLGSSSDDPKYHVVRTVGGIRQMIPSVCLSGTGSRREALLFRFRNSMSRKSVGRTTKDYLEGTQIFTVWLRN